MTKMLTLKQPIPTLAGLGVVRYVPLDWRTDYRGALLLRSGKTEPTLGDEIGSYQVTYGSSGWHLLGLSGDGAWGYNRLPLGYIVASCTLANVVPIVGEWPTPGSHPHGCLYAGGPVPWQGTLWRSGDSKGDNAADQLPYGDFTPGRYAWILEDVKPTTKRCPACWGTRARWPNPCSECWDDYAQVSTGTCDPIEIDVPDLDLQEWTP